MEGLIEKNVEKGIEQTQTPIVKFWDNLEKTAEVNLPERIKAYREIAAFWDDLVSDNMTDVNETTRPLTDEEKVYYKEKLGLSDEELDKCTIENGEFRRPLNEEERTKLKEGCMSDANIDKCSVDENGKVHLKTINEGKEDQEGENGVKYERKTIIVNGIEIEGVFPVFDSAFDAELPEDLLKASDAKQEGECNKQLKEAVENDSELANQFTPEQQEQIKNGDTPDGYTWHHNEKIGKMELVKTEDHQNNRHTGGKSIWGGGKESR